MFLNISSHDKKKEKSLSRISHKRIYLLQWKKINQHKRQVEEEEEKTIFNIHDPFASFRLDYAVYIVEDVQLLLNRQSKRL